MIKGNFITEIEQSVSVQGSHTASGDLTHKNKNTTFYTDKPSTESRGLTVPELAVEGGVTSG